MRLFQYDEEAGKVGAELFAGRVFYKSIGPGSREIIDEATGEAHYVQKDAGFEMAICGYEVIAVAAGAIKQRPKEHPQLPRDLVGVALWRTLFAYIDFSITPDDEAQRERDCSTSEWSAYKAAKSLKLGTATTVDRRGMDPLYRTGGA